MPIRLLHKKRSAWKGLLGGLAGGLAATVVMTQFQNVWSEAAKLKSSKKGTSSDNSNNHGEEKESAPEKTASKLAELAGKALPQESKKNAGSLVHYGFGTVVGALYGLGMEMTNGRRKTRRMLPGVLFGAGLFLAADELALPALDLSGKPSETPLETHLYGLVSHLVYGLALERARKTARKLL